MYTKSFATSKMKLKQLMNDLLHDQLSTLLELHICKNKKKIHTSSINQIDVKNNQSKINDMKIIMNIKL